MLTKSQIRFWKNACSGLFIMLFLTFKSWAFGVTAFSPHGQVGTDTSQIRVTFSEPMIPLGEVNASAPLSFSCSLEGNARWIDERTWIFDLKKSLMVNQICHATIKSGLKSIKGNTLEGTTRYRFFSGPLRIVRTWPLSYEDVEEEQVFVLQYNGHIAAKNLAIFFQIEGFSERIPAVRVSGKDREILLKKLQLEKNATNIEVIRCQRRLPAEKKIQLLWRLHNDQFQKISFTVRSAFKAALTCVRENAKANCLPIKPIQLDFSSPISKKMAEKIRLRTPLGERKPFFMQDNDSSYVWTVQFLPPFPSLSEVTLHLPENLIDESGRKLLNATVFPMKFQLADAPPLVKFAAAPFGIIEWNKEAFVPLTVRHVEMNLAVQGMEVGVGTLTLQSDKDIIYWLKKVDQYHETQIQKIVNGKKEWVQTRRLSLLNSIPGIKKQRLPTFSPKDKTRPFEVIGIPIKIPGLHVLEVESHLLGKSLLGENQPMYVRTAALVTNLAVHLKEGRENAAVWVTTLDRAKPVEAAEINIYDCTGKQLWQGKTDKNGIANVAQALLSKSCASNDNDRFDGIIVIARKKDKDGKEDVSFVRSTWNQGIESWRFPVSTYIDAKPALIAHSVFDRTLFRAGETLSMKHFIRENVSTGLGFAKSSQLPTQVRIVHNGSGQEYRFPLSWRKNRYAETSFTLPKDARLGMYSVILERPATRQDNVYETNVLNDGISIESGVFRVEAFRLPFMTGQWTSKNKMAFGKEEFAMQLSMGYSAGGPAKALPVELNAILQTYSTEPSAEYREFSFDPPEADRKQETLSLAGKVILNKACFALDQNGKTNIKFTFPAIDRPYQLITEANYRDPNGEVQTLSKSTPIWPSALRIGITTDYWASVGRNLSVKSVVLGIDNKPIANQSVRIKAIRHHYLSTRKRLVGGFYAYETEKVTEEEGTLCTTKTDARGFAFCDLYLKKAGNIELIAETIDSKKRKTEAAKSVWVMDKNEIWFDLDNNDRIDILPEKPEYKVGDKARFQVRMPFRTATAWVAIEREGIVETRVIELQGKNPSFEIEIKPEWTPNVFVSVLAVRGRIKEVPWYSFFTWGWKTPLEWWGAYWNKDQENKTPTALVDLGKPSFKYGLAEINVNDSAHRLHIDVKADKSIYGVRKTANVEIAVRMPNGQPAPAGTEVIFAAVDEALLELMSNKSWKLLEAMLQRHHYGGETATAQLQVVGKRHFGRKALEPGGGGGEAPTRELFDTLLLWKSKLTLNAQGKVTIKVPFNDSLTRFRLVAIADVGTTYFGTGSTAVQVTQDVQLVSGLPLVVREEDVIQTGVTVRNGTTRAMNLNVKAQVSQLSGLNAQKIHLGPGMAQEVRWTVTAPKEVSSLTWQFSAQEIGGKQSEDRLRITQVVEKAVPITIQQATLYQVRDRLAIPISLGKEALSGQGGVDVSLQGKLIGEMPSIRDFWEKYPYSCLEQRTSKALGLQDRTRWDAVMQNLDIYLDEDGLASYFPIQEGETREGSDTLTAYILSVANEADWPIPKTSQEKMLRGLMMFVEGRIKRDFWFGYEDLTARKLAALEALSRYGKVTFKAWSALEIQPKQWSSAMLIDWLSLLQRVPTPDREQKIKEAEQLIRAKMIYRGTMLQFADTQKERRWWLMGNADVNAARLFLTVSQLPNWQADLSRLIHGLIKHQQNGVWYTTNANVWGMLAMSRFAKKFEGVSKGQTIVALDQHKKTVSWEADRPTSVSFAWPKGGKGVLTLDSSTGKPWTIITTKMALPLKQAQFAGYRIYKTIIPIQQQQLGVYSRGDVVRIKLDIKAQTNMGWVVINDPIPAGAVILGSRLGRDSTILVQGQHRSKSAWPTYIERGLSYYQAYYRYVPQGSFSVEYTMRINNTGTFQLPPTRVEALYAPDVFGAMPNPSFKVVDDK